MGEPFSYYGRERTRRETLGVYRVGTDPNSSAELRVFPGPTIDAPQPGQARRYGKLRCPTI
jgi:hypothetical protein